MGQLLNRYRVYLLGHALIVLLVIGLFRWVPDRKYAALFAGSLFVLGPLLVVRSEKRQARAMKSFSWWAAFIFLFISALPILLLRLMYWDANFADLHLFGFSAVQLHSLSNWLFVGLLIAFFLDSFIEKRKELQQSSPRS